MEVKSCSLCEAFTTPTTTLAVKQYLPFFTVRFRPNQNQNASIHTPKKHQFQQLIRNYGSEIIITGSTTSEPPSTTKRRTITRKKTKTKTKTKTKSKTLLESPAPLELENSTKQTQQQQQQQAIEQKGKSVRGLSGNLRALASLLPLVSAQRARHEPESRSGRSLTQQTNGAPFDPAFHARVRFRSLHFPAHRANGPGAPSQCSRCHHPSNQPGSNSPQPHARSHPRAGLSLRVA